MKSAFRCRACGHLEPAEHAGDCAVPHACCVCAAGVSFDAKGGRTFQPENWEVLADATPERLAEIGLASVVRHEAGGVPPAGGKAVTVEAHEGVASKDRV